MLLLLLGVIAAAILIGMLVTWFSPTARLERRRRRSNAPVVSKANRPTVKFSVRTPKSKR